MEFDIALAIVFTIIGLVVGLIVTGLLFVFKLKSIENKARKSWKDKKGFFEVKQNEEPIKEEIVEEKQSLPPKKKSLFNRFKRNKEVN